MALEYAVFNSHPISMNQLTKKQAQQLKALGHSLRPVVSTGVNGLTEGVLAEIDLALSHHELIKVKVCADDRNVKRAMMDAIIRETNAQKVQMIGHTLVLYRASEKNKIELTKR